MATKLSDKDMAADLLKQMDDNSVFYQNVINQSTNKQFRDTIIQMRNSHDTFLYEFSHLADRKGFHDEGPLATKESIQDVKKKITNNTNNSGC